MRILITAGPTREPIDAVRFMSNRSSGKTGAAVAEAACESGHDVMLLLGPGPGPREHPHDCRVERFTTSQDLHQLLQANFPDHDVLIMMAAVADYRPAEVLDGKISSDQHITLTLRLERTPDLLSQIISSKRPGQKVIAFALEPFEQMQARAAAKLHRKGADAIVANPLGTLESDTIEPVWLAANGERAALGRMSKIEFGRWLVKKIADL